MSDPSNRRRFPRLELNEHATAVDSEGRALGRVHQVGGGGMSVELSQEAAARTFALGERFRITVIEPGAGEDHSVLVEVRYRAGNLIGLEFVSDGADEVSS